MDDTSSTQPVATTGSPDLANAENDMSRLAVTTEKDLVNASVSLPADAPESPDPITIMHEREERQLAPTQASVVVTSSTTSNGHETSVSQLPNSADIGQSSQREADPTADVNMAEPEIPSINGHNDNAEAGPSFTNQIIAAGSPFNAAGSAVLPNPLATIYRTGYIWDPLMMLHCPEGYVPTEETMLRSTFHPEDPMRIYRIYRKLAEWGLIARMRKLEYEEVTQEQVLQVHTQELWDKVLGQECMSSCGKLMLQLCANNGRSHGRDDSRVKAVLRGFVTIRQSRIT